MIEIQPAKFEEKQLIKRLLELYSHDLSEYEGSDLNEHGEFGYKYFDQYWGEADRHPFLVRFDGNPAGFVFVNKFVYSEGIDYSIAEFFVVRKYRRKGIGQKVVTEILGHFEGSWEIRALRNNRRAIRFWNTALSEITNRKTKLIEDGIGDWTGPIWIIAKETIRNKSAHTTPAIAPR